MSKQSLIGYIQQTYQQSWMAQIIRSLEQQVNAISEGRITGAYNAMNAAPTTGVWMRGDEVRNSEPSEAGSPGSMYVIRAWICVSGGEPGTWCEERVLTGN